MLQEIKDPKKLKAIAVEAVLKASEKDEEIRQLRERLARLVGTACAILPITADCWQKRKLEQAIAAAKKGD